MSQRLTFIIMELNKQDPKSLIWKNPEEAKCLRQDVDLYTRRIQEKIDIIKNRYNQYYLSVHQRRREEQEKSRSSVIDTSDNTIPSLKALASTSAQRNFEDGLDATKDIDYFDPLDVDIREQDNNSDIE